MKTPIEEVGSANSHLSPGALNRQKFESWIKDRDAANDWADYIRSGKLNRTEVAAECGFGTSAFRQNPSIALALQALEAKLTERCVIKPAEAPTDEATSRAAEMRILSSKASAERRTKAVEEQNAALKAEVNDLKQKLKQYKFLDEHLATTGRMLRP
jgi:cell division protein FtsB